MDLCEATVSSAHSAEKQEDIMRSAQALANAVKRIGLISDTHGLLRMEAVEALRGSELILHAGDVGKPEILEELRKIAVVVAVRGNVDTEAWSQALPETAVAEAGAVLIYVLHDVKGLNLNPAAAGFRIVVSGHSHKPGKTERDGVLYINPGSAGPRRFQLPVTVARLNLAGEPWKVEFVELEVRRE
jgi:putative phosphoesterase